VSKSSLFFLTLKKITNNLNVTFLVSNGIANIAKILVCFATLATRVVSTVLRIVEAICQKKKKNSYAPKNLKS